MRKTAVLLLTAFLLSACFDGLAATPTPAAPGAPAPPPTAVSTTTTPPGLVEARVVKVVDGDTIDVSLGGRVYPLRYIGMDTPEDTMTHEPGGPEATAKNKELVEGKMVRLEKDVSETDRFGRLLRYVYVGDVMVNAELVRLGFAQAATYPPDVKYQQLFLRLQREAQAAGRGLWATETAPAPTPAPQGASANYTCDRCIKGNINSQGEKIYHFPGCGDYDATVITESKGERWFSSEAEALSSGWRRAANCP